MAGEERKRLFWLALAGGLTLFLGFTLVRLNIDRLDTAYRLKQLQTRINDYEAHSAKLQIERDNLVTPSRLRRLAAEYGLGPAEGGQIRRIDTAQK